MIPDHMDAQALDRGDIKGKLEKTGSIASRLKAHIHHFSHHDLVGLHHTVSQELALRAEKHSSKHPHKMSDREFEKWATKEISKAKGDDYEN